MEQSKVNTNWPNALRWFVSQNLHSFTPWHLLDNATEFEFAAEAFEREDVKGRKVFVFASRQDNDDFAGIEIVDGKFTNKVIYFHPVFSNGSSDKSWDIVSALYEDVFEFMANQIIADMKDWALTEDAADI
ncbi:MAG: hypothetical protein ABW155_18275 [Candidatus Thiodiazotropha sp.]